MNVKLDNTTVEKVDYNERFHWNSPWAQGRIGFGPFGKRLISLRIFSPLNLW